VFYSTGSNDPGCYAPSLQSIKVTASSVSQHFGKKREDAPARIDLAHSSGG